MAHMLGRRIGRALAVVGRAHDIARPVYEAAKPVLNHAGVNMYMTDKALSTYDGIRRATGH